MSLRVFRFLVVAVILAIFSFGAYANGIPVIYQPLNPSAVAPGGVGFTLTVTGAGFTSSAVVNWNGSPRTTTFISSSQLTASIFASDIASAGTALITVTNPGAGGGTSNQIPLQVTTPTVGLAFRNLQSFTGQGLPRMEPVVADFNGDGKLDLAVLGSGNSVSILFGNGDGTFKPAIFVPAIASDGNLSSMVAGDFNGDGKIDLAFSYFDPLLAPASIGTTVLLSNGDGTFQPFKTTPSPNVGLIASTVADVNGDGKLDIISACDVGICLELGNGDGTFTPSLIFTSPVNVSGGPKTLSFAVGDFNGDGKLDIAFVAAPQYLGIIFGNGDGTFSAPSLVYDTGSGGNAVAAADFNGDGKLDLAFYYVQNPNIFTSGVLKIFPGNGDGTFQDPLTLSGLPVSTFTTTLVPGDFNADGHLDLAFDNQLVLIGNGNGIFSYSNLPLPQFASAAGDFDGDGKLDLVSIDIGSSDAQIMLQTQPASDFSGSANPLFQTVVPGSSATYSITVSPIDGFTATAQFSVSGLPAGATATFNPPTITGSGSTTLTISTSPSTATGSYTITLTGTSGTISHSGTLTLNVGPAGSDFTDFVGSVSPAYQTITPGSSIRYDLGVSPISGFTGTVTFSVSGLPAGATATFVPATVSGGSGTAFLNISTSVSTPTGSYPLIVTATSGSHVHSTSVNLNVGPAGTDFTDFTGFITPDSQTVAIGGAANYTLTVIPLNGFSEDIHLGQQGTPAGVSITASTSTIVGGSGSSVITFSPGPTAVPGTYTITISAVGDAKHFHTRTITLTITP